MTCCSEQTASLAKKRPGASQHVNYAKGMVLGVDDFTQEFAYLSGRTEWLARDLGGYGTTSGLVVAVEDDDPGHPEKNNPRIRVTSGSALGPRGSLICVPADQCAWINTWLATPKGLEASKALGASPATMALYLTLCYADCETTPVPIPGEPCRSEDELMKPSRIADGFRLEIRTQPPAQKEEDALRKLVEWLRGIQSHDASSAAPAATEKEVLDALRAAAVPWLTKPPAPPAGSQPSNDVPDLVLTTPPVSLRITDDHRCELLRAALRFWVTQLRPAWLAMCCGCAGDGNEADDCVLLARLDVPVMATSTSAGSVWVASGAAKTVGIDERRRPFLVHQRLLQEWLLCGSCCDGTTASAAPAGVQIAVDTVTRYPASLTENHHLVICLAATPVVPQKLALPKCAADNKGLTYVIKSPDAATSVDAAAGDLIDAAPSLAVKKGSCATLVSDGAGHWYLTATT